MTTADVLFAVFIALSTIAVFVAVLVAKKNAEHAAALRAETERAQRVAEDAKCVTPAAAQPRAKRKVRK